MIAPNDQQGAVNRPFLVLANVAALIGLGVGFSLWMLRYTDWFPIVGGLLALTGAFSWVAFLSNIISDSRKAQAQSFLDRAVLQRPATLLVLAVVAMAFVFGYSFRRGTLMIDALGDTRSRTGEIQAGEEPPQRVAVATGDVSLFLVPTPFFGQQGYRVKLAGLPAITVNAQPWHRTRVITPSDFWAAPVLLVRPTIAMSGEAIHGEFELIVKVGNAEWDRVSPYLGGSVWLGASEDVEIPLARIDRWRAEFLLKQYDAALVQRWTAPVSLLGDTPLMPGAKIDVTIVRIGDSTGLQGEASTELHSPQRASAFPQELVIDVKS